MDDFGEVGVREVPSFFFFKYNNNFKKPGSGEEGRVCLASWFLFPWQFSDAGGSSCGFLESCPSGIVALPSCEGLAAPVPSWELQEWALPPTPA